MRVKLLQRVPGLGSPGEIKEVKGGYALNYLIPKKMAVKTDSFLWAAAVRKGKRPPAIQNDQQKAAVVKRLESFTISFSRKASEKGRLYSAIDKRHISEELKKNSFDVALHDMKPAHIKDVGDHTVRLSLSGGVKATVTITVRADE